MSVVAVPGEGDSTMYVEVAVAPEGKSGWDEDEVRERVAARAVSVARDLVDDGVNLAKACARKFTEGLKELGEGVQPDEIELELGITLDAELGAVLAKTKASAQLQVTLRWQRS